MSVVHRMAIKGGAQCGAGPDKFGHLKLSLTGAPSAVTCPDCAEQPTMTREAALAALSAAAAEFRDKS